MISGSHLLFGVSARVSRHDSVLFNMSTRVNTKT